MSEPIEDIVSDMYAYDSGEIADIWVHRFAERLAAANDLLTKQIKAKDAEIEKLTADNMHKESLLQKAGETVVALINKMNEQHEEITKLRAALKPVLECDCWIFDTGKSRATDGAKDAIKAVKEAQRIYKEVRDGER